MHYKAIKPSTAWVEENAKFLVSRGSSWVNSGERLCGSDSPVNEELSTLNEWVSIILKSAGIRSPNLSSTISPRVRSSARKVNDSPCRITTANY